MNYRRTTTCSFCFKPGHNKRSCQVRSEWLLSKLESGNPDEKEWAKRELEEKKIRRCSFCRTPGHTKPNCESRQREINLRAADCLGVRRKILTNMIKFGLGVGSLISFEVDRFDNLKARWTKVPYIGLVNNILWDEITHMVVLGERLERREILSVEFFNSDGAKMETFCRLPEQICNLEGAPIEPEDFEVSVVSPVEQVEYPEEFLSFDACLDQMSKWYK